MITKAIAAAIAGAQKSDKPTLIACKTMIGFGAPTRAGTSKAHGEAARRRRNRRRAKKRSAGLTAPFEVPDDVLKAWREAGSGARGAPGLARRASRQAGGRKRAEFERRISGTKRPAALDEAIRRRKKKLRRRRRRPSPPARRPKWRIEAIAAGDAGTAGGSADLTGSNNTKAKGDVGVSAEIRRPLHPLRHPRARHGRGDERHVRCTAASCADRRAPSCLHRLCPPGDAPRGADGRRASIYVMTHDSIGLGEDGPTHQPVEHLAALRAMPNMRVFRPGDAVETAECWQMALEAGPTARRCWR